MSPFWSQCTGGLCETVARLTERDRAKVPAGGTVTALSLLSGIAAHDLYPAGQIQPLKRLQADRCSSTAVADQPLPPTRVRRGHLVLKLGARVNP
jgi:hypothetical protein